MGARQVGILAVIENYDLAMVGGRILLKAAVSELLFDRESLGLIECLAQGFSAIPAAMQTKGLRLQPPARESRRRRLQRRAGAT